MDRKFVQEFVDLLSEFEAKNRCNSIYNLENFKYWITTDYFLKKIYEKPVSNINHNDISSESIINQLFYYLNAYVKNYYKSFINRSEFNNEDDLAYLINLNEFGARKKIDLIRSNIHEKSTGIQIINRLIDQGWVTQTYSKIDKRSKILEISDKGVAFLNKEKSKINQVSDVLVVNLTFTEKMNLIILLRKLNDFHKVFYDKSIKSKSLLNYIKKDKR